jgi:hypothetical protein
MPEEALVDQTLQNIAALFGIQLKEPRCLFDSW